MAVRGLESEFARFKSVCLFDNTEDQISSARNIFFAGAAAASQRFLSIVDMQLSMRRKLALIRRISQEMDTFKKDVAKRASEQGKEA